MSKVLPILFNTDMVRAILNGRKTVTRRVVKPQLPDACPNCMHVHEEYIYDPIAENVYCARCGWPLYNGGFSHKAPYQPEDILYVRETWGHGYGEGTYIYKADDKLAELPTFKKSTRLLYKPSIHMPKEAARIWLKVMNVRVERLHDITEQQAKTEGIYQIGDEHIDRGYYTYETPIKTTGRAWNTARECFEWGLWNSTIKKSHLDRYGWEANPWVWVIEFERCKKPEEGMQC